MMIGTATPIRQASLADGSLLGLLALVWGSSFVFIKIAIQDLPPMTLALTRMAIAASILLLIALARGQAWPRGGAVWVQLLFLGMIGNSLPFFLIGWGEKSTPSNLAAILMATVPIFVAMLAHFLTRDERITSGKAVGITLGFVGVVVLIGGDALKGLGQSVLGQLAILAATLSYSLYGVAARRLPSLGSEMAVGAILACGVLAMAPLWLFLDRPWDLAPRWPSLGAVLWLGVLSTALGNLLFFLLMRRTGASFASLNNYLVPPLGLAWGFVLLGEAPGWNALLAMILILAGLACVRFLKISLRRSGPGP